jgi:hypothetical protein
MMKSGPNYRMSKAGKTNLAVNWNRANRAARRRSIIQGELYGAVTVKSKREKES